MNFRRLLIPLCLILIPSAKGQSPTPAGFSTVIEAAGGYEYVSLGLPSGSRENLHGFDVNVTAHIRRSFALRADGGYALGTNLYGRGNRPSILSYMGGPVVYPIQHKSWSVYGQALVGGALVSGTVPANGGGYFTGSLNRFAWAAGMGVQFRDTSAISYRLGGDFVRASFVNSVPQIQAANSYRVVASVVYVFGHRHRSR